MIKAIGLISPVLVPLILSGILFFSSEKENKAKLYLACYMVLITFVFAANYYYFEHNFKIYTLIHSLHIGSVLAIYPGAYIYVKLLVQPGLKSGRLMFHFIPSIIFILASAIIFYPVLSFQEREYFLKEYRYHPDFTDPWLKVLYMVRMANVGMLFIQVVVYSIFTMRTLKQNKKGFCECLSIPDKYQLSWLKLFNYALAFSAFICVFIYTISPQKLFGDERFLAYPLVLIAIILWFFGIMGNNQKFIQYDLLHSNLDNDPKTEPDESVLAVQLSQLFEQEKLYLDSELKIWDVARRVGSNRTYVSQTINGHFRQNFAAFVNKFRVKEALEVVEENPEISITELAAKCGFGSATTMNRAFKEFAGVKVSDIKKTATA